MSDYRIGIPSYNRVQELGLKTLKTLSDHSIPIDIIDIFVANEEQYDLYKNEYPNYNIVIGCLGIMNVRNFMFSFYEEGQKVISMDDDIEKIRMKNPREWEKSCFCDDELDLKKELDLCFEQCLKSGRSLWGVYPVENHFFMKNTISYDYKFCGGWMFGVINHKATNVVTIGGDGLEDYERCIRHYLKDNGMIRINYICCKTKYGNPVGGIGKISERNRDVALKKMLVEFPNLFKIKQKKDGPNPVLKDTRYI